MKIVGLTGSIAMGKSTAAAMLRRLGVPVHDADATVHRLMGPGGAALPAIAEAFPGSVAGGGVDRTVLGPRVFADPAALARLEAILHPLVHGETHVWLRRQALAGRPLVVLDIPLLFEAGRDRVCDAVLVVSAPPRVQRQRMLARPGMTEDRLDAVLSRQLADGEKRRRADFVIPTGLGKGVTFRAIRRILNALEDRPARHWPPPQTAGTAHA